MNSVVSVVLPVSLSPTLQYLDVASPHLSQYQSHFVSSLIVSTRDECATPCSTPWMDKDASVTPARKTRCSETLRGGTQLFEITSQKRAIRRKVVRIDEPMGTICEVQDWPSLLRLVGTASVYDTVLEQQQVASSQLRSYSVGKMR